MPHPPTDPRLDALAATAAVLWDALDQVDDALVDAALNNLTAALDREAAAAEPDEYDQSTWPPCEHCGRVQIHEPDCPVVGQQAAAHPVLMGGLRDALAALDEADAKMVERYGPLPPWPLISGTPRHVIDAARRLVAYHDASEARSGCPAVAPHQPPLDDRALGTAADDRYGEILDRLGAIANAEQSELLVELDEVVGKRLSEHEDAAAAAERAGTWGWT